jgi:hypothetical protein
MEGKTCTKCGEWKPFKEYYKRKDRKDGFRSECKVCHIAGKSKYYEANKEQIIEKKHQHYQENKEEILTKKKEYYVVNREHTLNRVKQHYQENKERIKKQGKIRYEAKKEIILEKNRIYSRTNKESILKRLKINYQNNREHILEYNKNRYQINRELILEKQKKYYEANKIAISERRKQKYGADYFYPYNLKRRSLNHKVNFTPLERKTIFDRDNWKCQNCEIKVHDRSKGNWNTPDKAHIDHKIPVSKGGNSEPNNLQTLCRTCNLTKRDKVEMQLSIF